MIIIASYRSRPINEDMRAAIEDDRAWFALRPDRNFRIRGRISGEFWPCDDLYKDVEFTIVTRGPNGSRLRRPLLKTETVPGSLS